ncbi:adenosylcobinamide-GDP ribazoletransferase [Paracoccus nototheniae]|uniref:Adenosylcobinamide-GDP ribazoletransferase n=1 Tax=Paracoccus nototheniae TaxID=2489002 RepID=A0ABW4DVG6_9RHOB|nr:adenosylcobinamide-GDP ribazoletransferase [Paracoccus nototheniae]
MARAQQILLALVFLTRLPLGRFLPPTILPLSQAAWAFPLAGLLIGALAGLPLWLAGPGLLPAALAVAGAVWLTGALHEDALADFADAGGGRDRAARLAIMRDSTIGSYGAAALTLTLLIRVAALAALGPLALIGAAAVGRVAPVVLMRSLPAARADGLGQGAGRPSGRAVAVAGLIGLLALGLTAPGIAGAGLALILVGAAIVAVSRRACRLLGGQTGDVLGAATLLAETAALTGMALCV